MGMKKPLFVSGYLSIYRSIPFRSAGAYIFFLEPELPYLSLAPLLGALPLVDGVIRRPFFMPFFVELCENGFRIEYAES